MHFIRLMVMCLFAIGIQFSPAHAQQNLICTGRYGHAQDLLDQAYRKYGTLYSGGLHFSNLDNIGATLDLYRLWKDMDDIQLRRADRIQYYRRYNPLNEFRGEYGDWSGNDWKIQAFIAALPLAKSAHPTPPDDAQIYVTATAMDLATSLAYEPDWWLHPEIAIDLSDSQVIIGALAQTDPLVDWLLTVQEASAAPWAIAWHLGSLRDRTHYIRLHRHAWAQYEKRSELHWAVAAALLMTNDSIARDALETLRKDLQTRTVDCSATNAEYAAFSILTLEIARNVRGTRILTDVVILPDKIRDIALRNMAMRVIVPTPGYYPKKTKAIASLYTAVENPRLRTWFNIIRTYYANTIEEVIVANHAGKIDAKTIRALNLLSVQNLIKFGRSADRTEQDKRDILTVAFLRYFALGQDMAAVNMLPELKALYGDEFKIIEETMQHKWPLDVRLSLVALHLKPHSVWLTGQFYAALYAAQDWAIYRRTKTKYGIDLPIEFRTAAFLQRDLEALIRSPAQPRLALSRAFRRYPNRQDRSYRRFRKRGVNIPAFLPRSPREDWPRVMFGFSNLIAWDEVTQLGPKTGLSRRISEALIHWAKDNANGWFTPNEEIAAALRQVIYLNRSNDTGTMHGKPLAQVAFQLLHRNYSDTAAAEATPYWFHCSKRCER